jgi:hypothetical protein
MLKEQWNKLKQVHISLKSMTYRSVKTVLYILNEDEWEHS